MLRINRDVLFAALRASSLLGAIIWLHVRPNSFDLTAIYWLLGIFALYSLLLYAMVMAQPVWAPKLYKAFLLPDVIFLSLLVRFTGSTLSEFEDAYFLLVALHTFYYQSMRAGLVTVGMSVCTYIIFNWRSFGFVHWSDLVLRLAFLFLVALSTGFVTWEIRSAHARLAEKNKSMDRKLNQITALYRVSQELGKAETQAQVQKLAVEATSLLLGAPAVYLMRPEGRRLQFVAWHGMDENQLEGRSVQTDEGVVGKVFRSREPQILADIQAHPDSALADLDKGCNLRAVVSAPILSENRILGVLNASRLEPGSFTNEDLELLGVLASMVASALSRTEQYESTRRQAITDPKTELYNYRYFSTVLEEYILNKACQQLSVLMLDIDHFKHINDTYGHQAGDEVLKQVAATFAAAVRSIDVVARFGGEEFVAMLPECSIDEAIQVGDRIRSRLESQPIQTCAGEIKVTVSLGATSLLEGESVQELISRADHAMYKAKESGRNRVRMV